MFQNFYINSNQRIRWLPCARIQNSIICRRSSRQCIARLIRLRSTLHPPPGSGSFAFRISRTRGFSRQFICLELKTHFWLCPNFKFCPQKPRFYSMFCSMVGFDGANVSDCFGCADRHHVDVCRIGTRQTSGWLMRSTQKCGCSPHRYSARFSNHIIWFSRDQLDHNRRCWKMTRKLFCPGFLTSWARRPKVTVRY